jgi:hypothetical protein
MAAQQPPTQTMKISEVKQKLNRLVNQIYRHETRVLVEKSGIPVAAIVSSHDLRQLERLDRERAERFQILDEFGEVFKNVPAEELESEVARAIAEVRAERLKAIKEFAAGFADQSPEEIERETARAIAELRGEQRRAVRASS